MTVVVVSVDRIPLGMLGPYGGEWVETPTLDRLASTGVVFHRARAESFEPGSAIVAVNDLLSESPTLKLAVGMFSDRTDWTDQANAPAVVDRLTDADEAPALEKLFAAGLSCLRRHDDLDVLIWLDCALAGGGWAPPAEWRGRHREAEEDDGDPVEPIYRYPPTDVAPGSPTLEAVRSGWADRLAYFDAMLGVFLTGVRELLGDSATVVFTAEQGEPLGEQGGVDPHLEAACAARTSIPLVVSAPGARPATVRQEFVSVRDLARFVVRRFDATTDGDDPLGEAVFGRAGAQRWYAFARVADVRILETAHWKLLATPTTDRLFAKPEDVWDVNDLARQRPTVVETLRKAVELLEDSAP
jgi:hypothetical protein